MIKEEMLKALDDIFEKASTKKRQTELIMSPKEYEIYLKMIKQNKIPRKLKKKCKTAYRFTLGYRGSKKVKDSKMRIIEADKEGYTIDITND